jgi:hypothetical protein
MAKALGKRGRSGEGRQKNTSKAKAPEKRKKRQKVCKMSVFQLYFTIQSRHAVAMLSTGLLPFRLTQGPSTVQSRLAYILKCMVLLLNNPVGSCMKSVFK